MSDHDSSTPKPLVLRVEISAEQAAFLAPLLGEATAPDTPAAPRPQHISEVAADARVLELKRLETDLEQR
jgi:hypothetical protein